MAIGFQVLLRERTVAPELVAKFAAVPVANVSDSMGRMTAGGARIRPLHQGGSVMAGVALTVKTRPGDNLMIHKALMLAEPGDVVVVDGGGDLTNALVGELMLSYARARGAAGMVIDGAVRDLAWIRENGFPVFAAGVTHRGPYKDGPGEINVPVAIDGMVIHPGDLVVGDEDGVLAVPLDEAEAVLAAASAKNAAEAKQYAATLAGDLDQKRWVDETLARLGCDDRTKG